MSDTPFVLDAAENPHPRMLVGALAARDAARREPAYEGGPHAAYWRGYLRAMADATGCTPAELEAWMDAHEART